MFEVWWLVQAFYAFLYNSALEFVFFILVDAVAKTPLREARNEDEKRGIWFYESLALILLSVLVYALDHTPYLLLVLTFMTIIYTQLCGRVDLRCWWNLMMTRWEEHQHHTENVKFINEQQQNIERWRKQSSPPPVSKPVLKRLSGLLFKNKMEKKNWTDAPVFSMNAAFNNQQSVTNPQRNASNPGFVQQKIHQQQVQQAQQHAQQQAQQQALHLQQQQQQAQQQVHRLNQHNTSASPTSSQIHQTRTLSHPNRSPTSNSWFTRNELRRRPLRGAQSQDLTQNSFSGTSKIIKNRFMSAFGLAGSSDKPAGLRNEGQNLCFMNCVIQCLSRSPALVPKLLNETKSDIDCSVAESTMVDALAELMSKCSNKASGTGILDPTSFRQSVSALHKQLVAPPTERQHQQDAAEFFMWLMESLHSILNKKDDKDATTSPSLSMLKFIYGDLKPDKIRDLKQACRKEISEANGLQNDSYAEPIQRLSDLEWLTHKQQHCSVIDNLFTGQLVEAYHCLSHNHLTVNTQTFNILPVPIVAPRNVSGLVFLEDCFTKFCNVEHLIGKEGLECSFCNKNSGFQNQRTPVLPVNMQQRARISHKTPVMMNSHHNIAGSSVDSALHSPLSSTVMSPIPGQPEVHNDSGFHDNVFRTSTPVGEPLNFIFPSQRLRDAQRRCLLRQLPECLVIQLLRFTYNQFSQQSRKITAPVSIPLKGLDMSSIVYDNVTNREDLTAEQQGQKYDLYAVCVHLGAESTSCGHYVCYCQSPDGVWYKFDDELVWDVNMEYEITTREIRENAYLLFYKRAPGHAVQVR